jgi:hypothetical protein
VVGAVRASPFYPKPDGRRPIGIERMLRIYFFQHWFNLSDPAVEEALCDSSAMRRFEFLRSTLDFIDRAVQERKSFFAWFNSSRMHIWTRLKPESQSQGKTGLGIYPDGMVEQLLKKLDDLGIANNTIVIYKRPTQRRDLHLADGGTTPFRSEKNTNWEGGYPSPAAVANKERLRALAVTGSARLSVFPEIPTVSEAALPGYEMTGWSSIMGPAGMHREIVDSLNAAIGRTLNMPDIRDRLQNAGSEAMRSTPEAVVRKYTDWVERFGKIAKQTGIKPQ